MRRSKMFFTAFLIGVLCWTPIMQPFAAYAQFVLADSPASSSSDNGADSQQGGDTLPDAGDSEVEGEQGLVPESESGAVEQPDAEDVGAESDHALQSGQEDATTPEVDSAADGVAIDNTANGFVENSWRYDNGVLRTDLESADRSLLSGDNRPEGATAWGIDVSNHQGAIDWAKVKAAGVDYAILRCGYGEGIMDDSFIRNVQGCKKYGIPFGVYLYCYAWDAQSAREEAEGTLSILSRAGVKPSDLAFPVYYDIENTVGNKNHPDYGKPAGVDGNNQYHVIRNNATFTAMAETYCNIIQNAGYEPGVYASLNWWRNYLNDSKFNSWDRWVAQYYSECTYEGSYSMWQYSSSGRVDGIRGNVDVNWYFDRYSDGEQHVVANAHISGIGWQGDRFDGAVAGTTGQSRAIEALRVSLNNQELPGGIEARAHCASVGWQDWTDGTAGTTGRSLPTEALQVRLTGEMAAAYDVYYRAHCSGIGWMAWAKNGEEAGTQGYSRRLEAVQVVLVEKGGQAPSGSGSAVDYAFDRRPVDVSVRAHVSRLGWGAAARDGAVAGTTGQSRAIEALRVSLNNQELPGGIEVRAHCASVGWQDWTDGTAGTTGRSLPMEALQVRLTGEMAAAYDVYYRAHSSRYGWLDWASNGATAGTTGLSLSIEAIQVVLVKKGDKAPGSVSRPSVAVPLLSIKAASGSSFNFDGGSSSIIGSTAEGKLNAFCASIDSPISGSMEYQLHLANVGWGSVVSNGATAGNLQSTNGIQAIRLRLTGQLVDYFDIWYRVYVPGKGWLGWAKNGASAGSVGASANVSALQVTVRAKGLAAPSQSGYVSFYSGGIPQSASVANARQRAILDSVQRTPTPGRNLCAEWVARVFANCGYGNVHMDAYEYYWNFCHSTRLNDLMVGMVISVPSHPHTIPGSRYGHVCIYIGDGKVAENRDGGIRISSLDWWLGWYGATYTPKWGWYKNIPLA